MTWNAQHYLLLVVLLGLIFSGVAYASALGNPPRYSLTDLGRFQPNGINNAGDVIGERQTLRGEVAVLWHTGKLVDLSSLQGKGESTASAINNHGHIVGMSKSEPVLWRHGSIRRLATPGFHYGSANGINEQGEIVGTVGSYDEFNIPVRWRNGHFQKIKLRRHFDAVAYSVNDSGEITGSAENSKSGDSFAFLIRKRHLFILRGQRYYVVAGIAINNKGQVLGRKVLMEAVTNFLWTPPYNAGSARDLSKDGYLTPHGLNNRGQVVGYVDDSGNQRYDVRAVLWQNNRVYNLSDFALPAAEWKLVEATAINDFGQIVGVGIYRNEQHAFLLTPKPDGRLRLKGNHNDTGDRQLRFVHL